MGKILTFSKEYIQMSKNHMKKKKLLNIISH